MLKTISVESISNAVNRFIKDESGPTAVEYAFLLALILLAVILSVQLLGRETAESFSHSASQIENAASAGS